MATYTVRRNRWAPRYAIYRRPQWWRPWYAIVGHVYTKQEADRLVGGAPITWPSEDEYDAVASRPATTGRGGIDGEGV